MKINDKLTICAYFFSKFDMQAVKFLGYPNRNVAMDSVSKIFGKEGNFLKRRRDEFDVFTGSHRIGQVNRIPAPIVEKMHLQLKTFTFEELGNLVNQLLNNKDIFVAPLISDDDKSEVLSEAFDIDCENFMNIQDVSATYVKRQREFMDRVLEPEIAASLKKFYGFSCQICGLTPTDTFNYNIVEAHHIIPFSASIDNTSSNIIIICPNHHRLIHKANPAFDRENSVFIYPNQNKEFLKRNFHLF